jgi:hypothetical protein
MHSLFCRVEPIRKRVHIAYASTGRPGVLIRLLQLGEELLQVGDFPVQRGYSIRHGLKCLFCAY